MAIDQINNQKTLQQIIDGSAKSASDRKTGEMGKDDFLKLLVTQLRYQDPLQPVDDKEFIGQMAQFSSLEQMQNMNTSMSQSQGFSLIGKHVTASIVNDKTKEVKIVEGDVTSVKVSLGKTSVVVNGEEIPVEKITDVTEGLKFSQTSNISSYTNLIGFETKGSVYDPKTFDIVNVIGTVKAIQQGGYEDYAVMDGVTVEVSGIVTDTPSSDPNYMNSYLEAHKPKAGTNVDNTVSIIVIDRQTGKKVPVTAKLNDYSVDSDGKTTATLDQVNVPVESITSIARHEP